MAPRAYPKPFLHRLGFIVPKARDCGDHEWHNTVRPHQALGYLTPAEFLATL